MRLKVVVVYLYIEGKEEGCISTYIKWCSSSLACQLGSPLANPSEDQIWLFSGSKFPGGRSVLKS